MVPWVSWHHESVGAGTVAPSTKAVPTRWWWAIPFGSRGIGPAKPRAALRNRFKHRNRYAPRGLLKTMRELLQSLLPALQGRPRLALALHEGNVRSP